jgi:putative methyltransferase (TIGR04325 family)
LNWVRKSKAIVKAIAPPALLGLYTRWRPGGIRFAGKFDSWQDALARSGGYDSDVILERVASSLQKVVSGEAAYERDSVLFDRIEHSFPVLAGLLRAAGSGQGLTVLDFGGSLGGTYYQCREFLSVLPELTWCVVEQEKFVQRGRERFETDQLRFFRSIPECVARHRPQVVLFSSVLQYLADPFDAVRAAMATPARCIIVDRTQFSALDTDWLCVQHVPPEIYPASYPCWIFGEQGFKRAFAGTFDLLAEFDALGGGGNVRHGLGSLPYQHKGMIWWRR